MFMVNYAPPVAFSVLPALSVHIVIGDAYLVKETIKETIEQRDGVGY